MNEEPKEIPSPTLDVATTAIRELREHRGLGFVGSSEIARTALDAADVPKMLADRERIGLVLFQNGYDAGYTTDGAVVAIGMMVARIAELEAKYETVDGAAAAIRAECEMLKEMHADVGTSSRLLRENCQLLARIAELEAENARLSRSGDLKKHFGGASE